MKYNIDIIIVVVAHLLPPPHWQLYSPFLYAIGGAGMANK